MPCMVADMEPSDAAIFRPDPLRDLSPLDRYRVREVLEDLPQWKLPPEHWEDAGSALGTLMAALVSGDATEVVRMADTLERLAARRTSPLGSVPLIPVPRPVRLLRLRLVDWLTAGGSGTGTHAAARSARLDPPRADGLAQEL